LLGVLWTSSIWEGRAPAGIKLMRCMSGDPKWLDLDDDAIVSRTCDELHHIYGLRGHPVRTWVFRHPAAIAEYEVGHLARMDALQRALSCSPGLFLAGSSYNGVAVNACFKHSEPVADAVRQYLVRRNSP